MVKLNNRDLDILQYIIENKDPKQAGIAEKTQTDRGNLSRRCNDLKELKLLKDESGLVFNNLYNRYLIIELMRGGPARYFIVDCLGNVISDITNFEYSYQTGLQVHLMSIINTVDEELYDAIGLVVHGKIKHNKIVDLFNEGDFDPYKFFSAITKKNIYVENFANLAALSHYIFEYADSHSLFYLRTNPGVGGGLVYHNRIFHGSSGAAMEPGWMIIQNGTNSFLPFDFGSFENELSNSSNLLNEENLQVYMDNLTFIIKNITSIVDPEILVVDSNLLRNNAPLIHMLNQDNVKVATLKTDECYKSFSKVMLLAETGIEYNKVGK